MMSIITIKELNERQARKAKKLKLKPYMAEVDRDERVFNMPNLGYYVPKGWKLIDKLFVDKTGFGRRDEPALTIKQFIKKVKAGLGYAICEEGEFQIYIGVFEKIY